MYTSSMSHSALSGSSLKHDESVAQHTTDINNTYGLLIIITEKNGVKVRKKLFTTKSFYKIWLFFTYIS